jgi:transcriptional regulator of arginine metabolism
MPGRAQGVGIYLDKIQDSHIIGTVAGDDSVIIIPDQHSRIPEIVAQIREIMQ